VVLIRLDTYGLLAILAKRQDTSVTRLIARLADEAADEVRAEIVRAA
jgi:predicted DNA-binding ribbon-helix-helix protein